MAAVVEGHGATRIGEHTVTWGPKDVFTIPAGQWVTHHGGSAPSRVPSLATAKCSGGSTS